MALIRYVVHLVGNSEVYDFVCILLSLTLMCALIKYCLNNEQECIIRFKNSRRLLLFFLFELLMCFLTWIREKELEREIKKGDEFCWKDNIKILYRRLKSEKC